MSAEARYFRVGLFVLTGVALIGACAVILGGQSLFQEKVLFETFFKESVQGLEVGSPVKVNGVRIGRVSDIGLLRQYYQLEGLEQQIEHAQTVVVRMELTGSGDRGPSPEALLHLERMVDEGLRLRLTSQGLTGTSYLEAAYLSPEDFPPMELAWTPEHYYVPSAPSTMSKIASAAERIASRLEEIDIQKLVLDLDGLLLSVRSAVDELQVAEIRTAATALIGDLRQTAGRLNAALDRGEIEDAAGDLRESIQRVSAILTRVDRMIDGGGYDVEVALENLRVASENLRDLTDTARSYPSLLILGEPPKPSGVSAR